MTTTSFSVRTENEKIQQLDALSKALDRSRNYLVNQAIDRLLDEHELWIAKVQKGLEAADRGDITPHDEVFAKLKARIDRHTS